MQTRAYTIVAFWTNGMNVDLNASAKALDALGEQGWRIIYCVSNEDGVVWTLERVDLEIR